MEKTVNQSLMHANAHSQKSALAALIFASLFLFSPGCASSGKNNSDPYYTVTVVGETRDLAEKKARSEILERGIGSFVKSRGMTVDAQQKENIISSGSSGYVKDFQVLEMKQISGGVKVTAKGQVAEKPLADAFEGKYSDLGKPKMMILIYENINGTPSAKDNTVAENYLSEKLVSNFTIIDRNQQEKILRGQMSQFQKAYGNQTLENKIISAAAENEIAYLIVGRVSARKGQAYNDEKTMHYYLSDVAVKVVSVGTAQQIAAINEQGNYPHFDGVEGSKRAIIAAINDKTISRIKNQVLANWKSGQTIRLSFHNIDYDTFLQKDILKYLESIPGVNAVHDEGPSSANRNIINVRLEALSSGNEVYRMLKSLESDMQIVFRAKNVKSNLVEVLVN